MKIVIPMAGLGSRFLSEGYQIPKPFIDISGKMMIEHVLEGLHIPHTTYILIIRQSFYKDYAPFLQHLQSAFPVTFVSVENVTQGAACTALAAHEYINNDEPVLFADSDNLFTPTCIESFITDAALRKLDGSLLTFKTTRPCYSYAAVNTQGYVTATKEKSPISTHAICGAYYFKHGADFVKYAIEMLIYGDKIKNEYYMSNVYNYAIKHQQKIGIYEISATDWNCVGTPEQLTAYLRRTPC